MTGGHEQGANIYPCVYGISMNYLNKYLGMYVKVFFQFENKNDFELVHELTFDKKKSIEALIEIFL